MRHKRRSATLLVLMTFFVCLLQGAQANLTQEIGEGRLYFSCVDDQTCQLTPTPIGEEIVTGQSTATMFQTETVSFEFDMSPTQQHIALLPYVLDELQLEFVQQTETVGFFRPEAEIRLITGTNINIWNFESSTLSTPSQYEPYRLENEELTYQQQRTIWPDQPVRVMFTAILDQPGTWELRLRGSSYVVFDIEWSIDPIAADVDEPSSQLEPVQTEFEMNHYGALVGADEDCWQFAVETNEIMRLYIDWSPTPLEIEQPHSVPLVYDSIGKELPYPEIVSEYEEGNLRIIYRWRAVPVDTYTVCFSGLQEKFQAYTWGGSFGFESLGPVNPDGFQPFSYFPAGSGFIAENGERISLDEQGYFGVFFFGFFFLCTCLLFTQPTTNRSLRYTLFTPAVIILLGAGIILPTTTIIAQQSDDGTLSFDELIDMRLNQLWDVSAPGIPDQNLYRHSGATFGLLEGDSFRLKLDIQSAYQTDDGRWQLQVEQLQSFRIDEAIFGQISGNDVQSSDDGMLEDHIVRFVLLSGRSLLLDLLMLETMLVVDEEPSSSVFELDLTMEKAEPAGSMNAPAWATRPKSIQESDWISLQSSLFPNRLTISLCDCELDLIDVRFEPSERLDSGDIPSAEFTTNIESVSGGMWLFATLGCTVCLLVGAIEIRRMYRARQLALTGLAHSSIWDENEFD